MAERLQRSDGSNADVSQHSASSNSDNSYHCNNPGSKVIHTPHNQSDTEHMDESKRPNSLLGSQLSKEDVRSTEEFVYSLYPLDCNHHKKRHPDAERFLRNFKSTKTELAQYLFKIINNNVFLDKLPCDLPIVWNSRLLKTSGQCKYLRRTTLLPDGQTSVTRLARIELSDKVCTNAERIRDTLLHEACHAATWLIDGVNDGHGPKWRFWADRARHVWPKLPVITVCHAYTIDTRFTYRCTGCGACVNRHSKSIDITKKLCGHCHSPFELLLNTPRGRLLRPSIAASMDRRLASHCQSHSLPPLNRSVSNTTPISNRQRPAFAEFVRENYEQVRHKSDVKSHAAAMSELGKMFKCCRLNN